MKHQKKLLLLVTTLTMIIVFGSYKVYKFWEVEEEPIDHVAFPPLSQPTHSNPTPDFSFGTEFRSTPEAITHPSQSIDSDDCTPLSPTPTLRARLESFKCTEGIMDSGFDRCRADIQYEIQYYCKPKATGFAELYCDLSYETQTTDGYFPMRSSTEERRSLYSNGAKYDSGFLEMSVRLNSIFSPVVRVKPLELSCRVSSY
jgi:hypothetical protein